MSHNNLFADSDDEDAQETNEVSNTKNVRQSKDLFGSDDSDDDRDDEDLSNNKNCQSLLESKRKDLFAEIDDSSSKEKEAPVTTKQVNKATATGGGGGKRLCHPVGGGGKEPLARPAPLFGDSSDSDDEKVSTRNISQNLNSKRKASSGVNHQRKVKPRVVLPEYDDKEKALVARVVLPENDDKEKALVAVKKTGRWLRSRSGRLRLAASSGVAICFGSALQFASDRLRDDEDVVLAAIQGDPGALQFASDRLKNDPHIVVAAVSGSRYAAPVAIRYASPALLENNRNLVLSLVNINPRCFQYLPSAKLKDDKEIALAAIKKDARQVAFASERLQSSDRDVILAAASNSTWLEQELSSEQTSSRYQWITRDREIMLRAVRSSGTLLRFASEEIRKDREVVVAAIESGRIGARIRSGFFVRGGHRDVGWLGDLLSEELLADRALNLLAAKRCGCFLNVELCKQDREIVLAGVSKNAGVFMELPEAFQADRDIALAALRTNPNMYSSLPRSLWRDYEIAMIAISKKGGCKHLPDMPVEFRGDRNIVLAALENYEDTEENCDYYGVTPPDWFASVSVELRSDPDIALKAVSRNGLFLRDVVIDGTGTRDLEIVKAAIAGSAFAFPYIPPGFDSHPEVVAEALRGYSYFDREEHFEGVRERVGESLMEKLTAINDEYELGEGNSDKIQVCEHQDVTKWSREWKKVLWHKVWLLEKMIPTNADVRPKILQFADILPDFRLARKIVEVGPVVEALAEMDKGVDDVVKPHQDSSDSESSS